MNHAFAHTALTRRRLLSMGAASLSTMSWRTTHAQSDRIDGLVAAMTPSELAARMFMFPVSGTVLTAPDEAWLRALKPGGVILVGENFGAPDDVRALVAAIHATNPEWTPLVALDQEGGIVSRIVDDPAPDAPSMGSLEPEAISELARLRAVALASYGFDVNFAPVADVAFALDSFMVDRAFSSDPMRVAEDVTAYLRGVEGTGVLHCVKHFPGHGRVDVDSHEALPTLDVDEAVWWEEDSLPFRAAVEAGVPMVMLGHLSVPMWGELPATLSPEAVGVLRKDLGFTGAIVTDDLGMGALAAWDPFEVIDLAVEAEVDLLLYVVRPDTPEALVGHLASRIEREVFSIERVTSSVRLLAALSVTQ
jgi:beta-N-acetylhexosaminidase